MPEEENRRTKRTHARRHRIGHYLVVIVMTLLVLAVGYGAHLYMQTKKAVDKTYSAVSTSKKATVIKPTKPLSILLMGTDTGKFGREESANSDTMIVVTINPKDKQTTMVSIPRDTLAEIVGGDTVSHQKINAAYNVGGNAAAIKTVTKLLNVPIDYYVTVNMAGLEKIVDAVGGVDVDVPFTWTDSHTQNYTFTKGAAHLDGSHALAYARMRYLDPLGDYGRQKRQREVITQIVKKALTARSLTHYQPLLDSLADNMRTDLKFDEMVKIATGYADCIKNIKQTTLQGMGVYINDAACQVATTKELQRVSDLIRGELGLATETLDNYDTHQNTYNTNAGFDWSDGNNPVYTLYQDTDTTTSTAQ